MKRTLAIDPGRGTNRRRYKRRIGYNGPTCGSMEKKPDLKAIFLRSKKLMTGYEIERIVIGPPKKHGRLCWRKSEEGGKSCKKT